MSSTKIRSELFSSALPDTPLMQQYKNLKSRYLEEILFFRLGDFYEMFEEDARRAAPLLGVTLTQRQGIPMCGIPYHAASNYISRLIQAGLSVAIAEQTEDPSATKGIVRREVLRVITPGTLLEENLLSERKNNFMMAMDQTQDITCFAVIDVSTGEMFLETQGGPDALISAVTRYTPAEILVHETPPLKIDKIKLVPPHDFDASRAYEILKELVGSSYLEQNEINEKEPSLAPAGALLTYIQARNPSALKNLRHIRIRKSQDYMTLDERAVKTLDMIEGETSLLRFLDRTVTAGGARMLREWLLHPLQNKNVIEERQNKIEMFFQNAPIRQNLRKTLMQSADINRILGRLLTKIATGRDLSGLRRTLRQIPSLIQEIEYLKNLDNSTPLTPLQKNLQLSPVLLELLEKALVEDPPTKLSEGGIIRQGYSKALDELRQAAQDGRTWLNRLEKQEKTRTGIASLKIGYNSVFGYYIEVSRSNLSKIPVEYIRKQTLVNAERFIIEELKTLEGKILGAEEKARTLESEILRSVSDKILSYNADLGRVALTMAKLDTLISLAEVAQQENFVRPEIRTDLLFHIKAGKHPVVDRFLGSGQFVPNDLMLDNNETQILLMTGPNMAGKSTYLRQTALIAILAHTGSYVPAESAKIPIIDRVFTRIGAADDLARGASTFMVEMNETASILHRATDRSLVILDEVGRGTSTFDGVAIAWAVVEYLAKKTGPKVLFATHYFELTELPETLPRVKNVHMAAQEWKNKDGRSELVFLHQVLPGPADQSYGIHVAEMAGLPEKSLLRAREILQILEKNSRESDGSPKLANTKRSDTQLFFEHPIIQEIRTTDPNQVTPLDALKLILNWKKKIEGDNS